MASALDNAMIEIRCVSQFLPATSFQMAAPMSKSMDRSTPEKCAHGAIWTLSVE